MGVSISLHPAQTAEDRKTNGREIKTDKPSNQGFSKVFLTQWLLYILPKGVLSNTSWNNGAYRNTQVLPSAFSFWGKIKGSCLFLFLFLILLNKKFL